MPVLTLRDISEAMTPVMPDEGWMTAADAIGISIFCDEAVRKALVEWLEAETDLKSGMWEHRTGAKAMPIQRRWWSARDALRASLAAAIARAQEKP